MTSKSLMSFVCAISGQTPEEPVFSPHGFVFEKRLISKALETNGGVCPISNENLSIDQLVDVKCLSIFFFIFFSKQIC